VNVIFQVPGHILKPDFEGVRTGYSSKKHRALIVQVALPEEPPTLDADELDAYLKQIMLVAVREAEAWLSSASERRSQGVVRRRRDAAWLMTYLRRARRS
jgi:hypothetical protein